MTTPWRAAPALALPRRDDLRNTAEALRLSLSDGQLDALMAYAALLQRWGSVFNLTAIRDAQGVLERHLSDCLAIVPALRRELARSPALPAGAVRRLLDVGSGAGLPGVLLAIVEPDWEVHCVDAVAKKAAFIRQVAAELGLRNLQAHHGRAENLKAVGEFDVVMARAFSSLADLVRLTGALPRPGGVWLAMKGVTPADEIKDLGDVVDVFHVEQLRPPGVEGQRCIVWMRRRNGVPSP